MTALFKALENEFCPPLDSSLLAALLAEVEKNGGEHLLSLKSPQIYQLRLTLRELATHADEVQLSEFADLNMTSSTDDAVSSQDFGPSGTTANTSVSSRSSRASDHSFSTPLGFLQATLPHVPINRLKKALRKIEGSGKEFDMWDLISNILSEEYIRELEERGLDALEDDDSSLQKDDIEWEICSPKSKKFRGQGLPSKRKHRSTKIPLTDIRQQHHGTRQRRAGSNPPLPDPWVQLQSIATHMADYLSPHPSSFFLSYLHSPQYQTPYQALCAALESLCESVSSCNPDEDYVLLGNLLDVLFPEYEPLDSEQRSRLAHEVQLCIRATNGRVDDILDIVKLLRELNSDALSGNWELGIYHLPPHKPTSSATTIAWPIKQTRPAPISPSPTHQEFSASPSPASPVRNTNQGNKPDPFQWQSVPTRRIPNDPPHLIQDMPVHAQRGANNKLKGSGNRYGKGGKGDVGELSGSLRKIEEHRRRQEDYLRQAAENWQRGNKKTRGGEIAYYYAEKARECQEMAKEEALESARITVHSKRLLTENYDQIDLHGTTVYEAVTIVKEILQDFQCPPNLPLKIVTGRGSHSANKIAVLKPAIKSALLEDGWAVGTWNAGLVVHGRTI